jgi:hypothetical protein
MTTPHHPLTVLMERLLHDVQNSSLPLNFLCDLEELQREQQREQRKLEAARRADPDLSARVAARRAARRAEYPIG